MKNNPFYYSTKSFFVSYHGGGYSCDSLKKSKRGKIQNFSVASQKRLCIYLDSIQGFIPEWEIVLTFNGLQQWSEVIKIINQLTKKLTQSSKSIPLFVWKKNIINGNLTIFILSNYNPSFNPSIIPEYLSFLLRKHSVKINLLKVGNIKNNIYNFCVFNQIDANYTAGRWWGIINGKYYKRTSIKKKIAYSTLELELLECQKQKIKNNLYKN